MVPLSSLSTTALLTSIESLVTDETNGTVALLHHLNELERREGCLELGYHSVFDYLRR